MTTLHADIQATAAEIVAERLSAPEVEARLHEFAGRVGRMVAEATIPPTRHARNVCPAFGHEDHELWPSVD